MFSRSALFSQLRALLLLGAAVAWPGRDGFAASAIPILAWHGPPANETIPERYRELAAAGFTDNFSGFANIDAMLHALDVARDAGIRQWASVPELQTDPEKTVERLMHHPALAGYFLRDEPSAGDFAALAKWAARIQAVDAAHPCYINLLPNYATDGQLGTHGYREYVSRFIAEVSVPFVSFDHYPVVGNTLRPEWYENLEIVSQAAADAKKPFWGFLLAVAHNPYPVPTLGHLRLEAFSNLAYGAQAIQHFTYWTPKSTVWNFHMAPIESDGTKTPMYDRVRQINAEIHGLSDVFLGSRVVNIGHLDETPRGTKPFAPSGRVKEVRADGPALVSMLEKGDARYLVVVNRALDGDRRVEVRFSDDGSPVEQVQKDGSRSPLQDDSSSVVLSAGDVAVYRWKQPQAGK